MNKPNQTLTGSKDSVGTFHYLEPAVESSLYRNGKVLTRRDPDGSDAGSVGVDLEQQDAVVHDARQFSKKNRRTIGSHGFELVDQPILGEEIDFFDHRQVVENYYGQCARIVEQATGARAFAFDHNIRSATGKQSAKRITGGQTVQGPAHVVHGDYTLTSAPQRLRDLAKPPSGNDTLASVLKDGESLISQSMVERSLAQDGRFAIINVWRNIDDEPVATHPIALCDGQTVEPKDLVVFEIHYQDRVGENYFAKQATAQQWYYYPGIERSEALLIKQWDSAGPLATSLGENGDGSNAQAPCTFSFHSAFEDPTTPDDAPDRWSIEVRCIVIYD